MKGSSWLLCTSVSVLAIACLDPIAPPAGAQPMTPPPVYRFDWEQMEICSGLKGDFARVHWFRVPKVTFPCAEGGDCLGEWEAPHNIYLSETVVSGAPIANFVVAHEILHDLLGGGGDHPPIFDTCGVR